MLDRKFIVENADLVKRNCANRGAAADVDSLVQLEQQRREKLHQVQDLNRQANEISKSIGKAKDPQEREARKDEGRRLREAKEAAQTEHDRLDPEQLTVYSHAEQTVTPHIASPQVVIHLTDTMDNCIARIRHRGRDYEESITPGWLGRLADAYDRLLTDWQGCPVIRIDVSQLDLRQPSSAAQIADELHRQTVYT